MTSRSVVRSSNSSNSSLTPCQALLRPLPTAAVSVRRLLCLLLPLHPLHDHLQEWVPGAFMNPESDTWPATTQSVFCPSPQVRSSATLSSSSPATWVCCCWWLLWRPSVFSLVSEHLHHVCAVLVDESLLPAFVADGHFNRKLDPAGSDFLGFAVEGRKCCQLNSTHTYTVYMLCIYFVIYIYIYFIIIV